MRTRIRTFLTVAVFVASSLVTGCSTKQYLEPRPVVDINYYRLGRAVVAIYLPFSAFDEHTFLDVVQTVDFGEYGTARTTRFSSDETQKEGVSLAIVALKPGHYEFENLAHFTALGGIENAPYANFKNGTSPIIQSSEGSVSACLDKVTRRYTIDVNPWDFSVSSSSPNGCI